MPARGPAQAGRLPWFSAAQRPSAPVPGGTRSLRSTATPRSRCEVGRPMPISIPFPTVPIDLWGTAVGTRPALFPVARTIGGATRDSHLHLVDGDGASLCERFTQQELECLPL